MIKRQKIYAVFDGEKDANNLTELCLGLLAEQTRTWPDLHRGYESLKGVRARDLPCNGFSVHIQHNPGRIKSTMSVMDNSHINKRPCFLCLDNLPEAQKGILYRNTYLILCNPAPVFFSHLTISHLEHRPQAIGERIDAFLQLAMDLGDRWTTLYNGPQCGASAPDHIHFQGIPSGLLPVEKELCKKKHLLRIKTTGGVQISIAKNLGREAVILEGEDSTAIANVLREIFADLKKTLKTDGEPMINLACFCKGDKFRLVVFPRAKHRPDVFFKKGNECITVSPATIEMCGVIITPVEKDFERLDTSTLEGIYKEVSLRTGAVEKLSAQMI